MRAKNQLSVYETCTHHEDIVCLQHELREGEVCRLSISGKRDGLDVFGEVPHLELSDLPLERVRDVPGDGQSLRPHTDHSDIHHFA